MKEVKGPGEMDFTSSQNLCETWRRRKRGMEYYLTATCTGKSEEQKVAIFMCMIGKDGQEIKDIFEFETGEVGQEVVTAAIVFAKFDAHCKPKKNLVVERHRFLTREQLPGESLDQYVTELRTLAASCEWGNLKDDLVCSRIVNGISSRIVRERLLRESDLKLEKAVEICRADELSKKQMKLFGSKSSNVNLVKRGGAYRVKNKSGKADKTQETKKATEGKQENKRNACGNCGLIHTKGQCLAYGKQSNKCKKINHYARMCRSSKSVNSYQQQPGKSDDYLFLETVKVESVNQIRQSETEYI